MLCRARGQTSRSRYIRQLSVSRGRTGRWQRTRPGRNSPGLHHNRLAPAQLQGSEPNEGYRPSDTVAGATQQQDMPGEGAFVSSLPAAAAAAAAAAASSRGSHIWLFPRRAVSRPRIDGRTASFAACQSLTRWLAEARQGGHHLPPTAIHRLADDPWILDGQSQAARDLCSRFLGPSPTLPCFGRRTLFCFPSIRDETLITPSSSHFASSLYASPFSSLSLSFFFFSISVSRFFYDVSFHPHFGS